MSVKKCTVHILQRFPCPSVYEGTCMYCILIVWGMRYCSITSNPADYFVFYTTQFLASTEVIQFHFQGAVYTRYQIKITLLVFFRNTFILLYLLLTNRILVSRRLLFRPPQSHRKKIFKKVFFYLHAVRKWLVRLVIDTVSAYLLLTARTRFRCHRWLCRQGVDIYSHWLRGHGDDMVVDYLDTTMTSIHRHQW